MKMMMTVTIPHEPFNTLVRAGTVSEKLGQILAEIQPEAVYFTEQDGTRGLVAIIELADPSRIPSFAEPFFLTFNADVRFRVIMTPEDLANAGLDALGKKWG